MASAKVAMKLFHDMNLIHKSYFCLLKPCAFHTTMDRLNFLRSFHPISDNDYTLLTENLLTKNFQKGEHVIRQGEIQRELYFIKSGVQMCHIDTEEKTHVLAFTYYPNLVSLPESFSFQLPSKYFFTCITDTELDCLRFQDLQEIYKQSQDIERLFRKINEKLISGLLNQHIELRTLSIAERFKKFSARSPHLFQLVPHKYIASYLDIEATNFSKLFNKIKI
jgi:CRP-like cAMP-binding protein